MGGEAINQDLKCDHCQRWLICNSNRLNKSRKQADLQLEDQTHPKGVSWGGVGGMGRGHAIGSLHQCQQVPPQAGC